MWSVLLCLIPVVLYVCNSWLHGYWVRRGVFQTSASFLFGHVRDVVLFGRPMKDITTHLYRNYKEKKLIGFYSFYRPILLVTDPELIKKVLVTDFRNYNAPGFELDEETDPLLGLNPFSTENFDRWKERRTMHLSLHTPAKLKSIPSLLVRIGHNMVDYVKKSSNKPISLKEVAELFAMDAAVSTGFGLEPTAFKDIENVFRKHAGETVFTPVFDRSFTIAMLFPIFRNFISGRFFAKSCEGFFGSLANQLISHRQEKGSGRTDIIDVIMKTNEKLISQGKEGLPEIEKAGHAMTAYLKAYFTTSSALRALLIDLSRDQEQQDRLREEIRKVGTRIEDFTFEVLLSVRYLQMAISESLRKHPPLQVLSRKCTRKSQLGGVEIEEGTKVFIPAVDLHWDPDYFPEPDKYLPERFDAEENIVKGAYLPFGDGPRMCLGNRYAQLVMKMATINLLLNFKILPEKENNEKDLFPESISVFVQPSSNVNIIFKPL